MAKQITITNIVGEPPYNIYICTSAFGQCSWYAIINDGFLPYSFLVPTQYENFPSIGVKVIDKQNCEIKSVITI